MQRIAIGARRRSERPDFSAPAWICAAMRSVATTCTHQGVLKSASVQRSISPSCHRLASGHVGYGFFPFSFSASARTRSSCSRSSGVNSAPKSSASNS